MGHYAGTAQLATAAAKPMLSLTSDGTVQPQVTLIVIGFSATPDDKQYLFGLYEGSGEAGGTAITPKKIGHAATSAATLKKGTFTTDPTKSGIAMVSIPIYQRSTAKVQKAFGEGYMQESLAADRGLGIWCDVSPAAINGEYTLDWWE